MDEDDLEDLLNILDSLLETKGINTNLKHLSSKFKMKRQKN